MKCNKATATGSMMLVLAWSMTTLACEYDRPLINGYKLVRTNAYEVRIHNPEKLGTMIGGSISEYAVWSPYITGHAVASADDLEFDPLTRSGYFLVNTETDAKREGLTEREWIAAIKEIGWIEPKLRQPP